MHIHSETIFLRHLTENWNANELSKERWAADKAILCFSAILNVSTLQHTRHMYSGTCEQPTFPCFRYRENIETYFQWISPSNLMRACSAYAHYLRASAKCSYRVVLSRICTFHIWYTNGENNSSIIKYSKAVQKYYTKDFTDIYTWGIRVFLQQGLLQTRREGRGAWCREKYLIIPLTKANSISQLIYSHQGWGENIKK